MQPSAMAKIFKVLATERRLQIMRILLDSTEPVPSSVIGSILNLDDGPVSFNMAELLSVGLVTKQASGRWIFWSANQAVMNEVKLFWKNKDEA